MSHTKITSRSARKMVAFVSMSVGAVESAELTLQALDDSLNKALLDTFPASDPVSSLRFD